MRQLCKLPADAEPEPTLVLLDIPDNGGFYVCAERRDLEALLAQPRPQARARARAAVDEPRLGGPPRRRAVVAAARGAEQAREQMAARDAPTAQLMRSAAAHALVGALGHRASATLLSKRSIVHRSIDHHHTQHSSQKTKTALSLDTGFLLHLS